MLKRDMWRLFDEYAKVANISIPVKLGGGGGFAFVLFLNIKDEKRMESTLGGIWVERCHLYVSL